MSIETEKQNEVVRYFATGGFVSWTDYEILRKDNKRLKDELVSALESVERDGEHLQKVTDDRNLLAQRLKDTQSLMSVQGQGVETQLKSALATVAAVTEERDQLLRNLAGAPDPERTEEKVAQLSNALEDTGRELEHANSEVNRLRAERNTLRKQVEAANKAYGTLRTQYDISYKSSVEANEKILVMERQLEMVGPDREAVEQAKLTIHNLQMELQAAQEDIERGQQARYVKDAEISRLEDMINSLRLDIRMLDRAVEDQGYLKAWALTAATGTCTLVNGLNQEVAQ